jgi:hypothetical protein
MKRAASIPFLFVFLAAPLRTPADQPERTSTVADRESVNLTIYNGGLSLVHDRRCVELSEGVNLLAWRDVSAQMDATSVLLDSGSSNRLTVLEQNFDFDLLDPSALSQRYVGKQVTIVHDPQFAGERENARDGAHIEYQGRRRSAIRRPHRDCRSRAHHLSGVAQEPPRPAHAGTRYGK